MYLPTGRRRNEDQIVAEELRFAPEEIMIVRGMLHLGTPIGEPLVRQIAARLGVESELLLPFAELPLRAFRQKAICGNAVMRAVDGGGADIEVPMAFQSALAGVMLAAEIVASSSNQRLHRPEVRTSVDLMRRFPARITFPAKNDASDPTRCICQDQDYLEAYREKYGV